MTENLLSTRAMLVHPLVRSHTFTRRDKTAESTAASTHNADPSRLRMHKHLVPQRILAPIQANESQLRALVRQETLPWRWEGVHLLPNKNYERLLDKWNCLVEARDDLVSRFHHAYSQAYAQWSAELGTLGHEFEYPEPNSLSRRFQATLELFPIPNTQDFRTDLPAWQADEIRQTLNQQQDETLNDIQNHLTETLQNLTTRLLEALQSHTPGDQSSTLRQPLLDTVEETLTRLQRLNILDNPNVQKVSQHISRSLAGLSASDLREIPSLRQQTANDIQSVLDVLFSPLPQAA